MSAPFILLTVAVMVVGATHRPIGWIASGLAVVALLVHILAPVGWR